MEIISKLKFLVCDLTSLNIQTEKNLYPYSQKESLDGMAKYNLKMVPVSNNGQQPTNYVVCWTKMHVQVEPSLPILMQNSTWQFAVQFHCGNK